MALGITFDFQGYIPKGPSIRVGRFTADTAYVAGGYAVTPDNLNFQNEIVLVIVGMGIGASVPGWDQANKKLKFYQTGAALSGPLSEAVAADLTAADIVPFVAFGN